MNDAPAFWWQNNSLAAFALTPFSGVYGWLAGRRMAVSPRYVSSVPVLCIGNLVAGGAGKTPTAIALAHAAGKLGLMPGFLSRGYGGRINTATVVDLDRHNALDVGDEPPLLAAHYPTVVSPDRTKGARLLEQQGVDFVVMDDGFQNPSLHKDYSLVVVDADRGIGNGFSMPAGPLRARLGIQLSRASAILVIGRQNGADKVVRAAASRAKPVYEANFEPVNPAKWKGQKVLAFAGIANPEKFRLSLNKVGVEIIEFRSFGDHHPFTEEEAEELLFFARRNKLNIVTTSKDISRLASLGRIQRELSRKAAVFEIELRFDSRRILHSIIDDTVENAKAHRLTRSKS